MRPIQGLVKEFKEKKLPLSWFKVIDFRKFRSKFKSKTFTSETENCWLDVK